jgi:hypothetical protein
LRINELSWSSSSVGLVGNPGTPGCPQTHRAVLHFILEHSQMQLSRLLLTASQLNRIPAPERGLLVLCGHVVNELNVLNKWLLPLTQGESQFEPVNQGQTLQSMVLLKSIVGKLNEAWAALTKGYLRTGLARELSAQIAAESLASLEQLKKYFGRKSAINTVRNNFSFHYSLSHASQPIPEGTPREELAIYLTTPIGNSLYQFAETSMNGTLLRSLGESPALAMEQLLGETQQVVGWFNDFAHGLMIAILERHVFQAADAPLLENVDIGAVASFDALRLDYFIDIDTLHDVPTDASEETQREPK